KEGKLVRQELVTVAHNGRQVLRIAKEPGSESPTLAWEKSVAELSAEKQVEAVKQRLQERNSRFDGRIKPVIRDGAVIALAFNTDFVSDLSPLRALTRLESLECCGSIERVGMVADLSPLRGLPLRQLYLMDNHV